MNPAQRYDVRVWLRDRPATLQGGEWLVQHSGVTRDDALSLTAEARRKGDRTRVVFVGTELWAQAFAVWTEERTLEAVFWCEEDALDYAILLRREEGVRRCTIREVWRASPEGEALPAG